MTTFKLTRARECSCSVPLEMHFIGRKSGIYTRIRIDRLSSLKARRREALKPVVLGPRV